MKDAVTVFFMAMVVKGPSQRARGKGHSINSISKKYKLGIRDFPFYKKTSQGKDRKSLTCQWKHTIGFYKLIGTTKQPSFIHRIYLGGNWWGLAIIRFNARCFTLDALLGEEPAHHGWNEMRDGVKHSRCVHFLWLSIPLQYFDFCTWMFHYHI